MPPSKRLLLMACSQTKLPATAEPVAAWELYQGPAYRICKKLQREGRFPADVKVLLVSARHGVIPPETRIFPYDDTLKSYDLTGYSEKERTAARAALRQLAEGERFSECFFYGGVLYWRYIGRGEGVSANSFLFPEGGIGLKLQALKRWLEDGNRQ